MTVLVDPEPDAVMLRPNYSADDRDIPMGLNGRGVSYLRRGGPIWRLGYEYRLETVPYSEISVIELRRESTAHRVTGAILGVLVGLAFLIGPIVAFFNGILIIGLLVFASPLIVWFSLKSLFERNGFRLRIKAKSEKGGKFTLSWDEWCKHRAALAKCLTNAGPIVEVVGVDIASPGVASSDQGALGDGR